MRRLCLLPGFLLLLLPGLPVPPVAAEPQPRQSKARIDAHVLTVRFDPPRHRLVAHDVMTVQGDTAPTQLVLRLAPTLTVTEVTCNGEPATIRADGGSLTITVPANGPHKVGIAYHGTIYDAVEKADDLTWVVGDHTRGVIGEMGIYLSDASGWVPLPVTEGPRAPARFHVTTIVPAPFVVVTQGGPVSRQQLTTTGFDPGSTTLLPVSGGAGAEVVWNHATNPAPIPTDGLSLSAGPYRQKSRDVDGIKLSTFFYARHARHADVWLDAGEETIRRYAKLLGPYVHKKFDIVENFFQSGYGMPAYTLLGDRVVDYVTAKARRHGGKIPPGYLDHEYVHCWFGNGLFVDYARGNWCEAITTYFSNYMARELDDPVDARAYRRGVLEKFAIRVRGDADYPLRKFVTKTEDADNDVGYGKGAMFFHMLRQRVGDEAFFKGVRAFVAERMGTVVTWDNWLEAFDRDGAANALRPFLDRPGMPRIRLRVRETTTLRNGGADVGDTRIQGTVRAEGPKEGDAKAPVWPMRVPLRFKYRSPQGVHAHLDTSVVVVDRPATFDVVVPGSPTSVEVDPDFHVMRHVPSDDLPHCLNRTLETGGNRVLVVDAPDRMLDPLADRIARGKGFVRKSGDYDWRSHEGPVVLLRVLPALPEGGVKVGDEHFDDPTVSVVRSWGTPQGPRTEYLALSPDAAKRAGYVTYYGWDSWVTFRNGIPRDRRTHRPTPGTRVELLSTEEAAAKRVAGWIQALSATTRAPGQRKAMVEKQLQQALSGLAPLDVSSTFWLRSHGPVRRASINYVMGTHQGSLSGRHVRPFCFSDNDSTPWIDDLVPTTVHPKESPAQLFARLQKARRAAVVVVDDAGWKALAPWLDTADNLTEPSRAELERPGRDGKPRPKPPSLTTWISGRRARGGLPTPAPLPVPVLCVHRDVFPKSAGNAENPMGAFEEVSLDIAMTPQAIPGRNLLAWKPPWSSEAARPPVVVLTAHYDGLPWRDGVRYRGADDNASGVACLLEVARALEKGPGAPAVGIVIALTDAEEWGLYGARALRDALASKVNVRAVINVDSIGRASAKPCHLIGHSTHRLLAKPIEAALAAEGIELGTDIDRYAYAHGSDHYPFHQVGIPAVSLWASDYHVMNTVADTPDRVQAEGIARIAQALTTLLQGDLSWVLKLPAPPTSNETLPLK